MLPKLFLVWTAGGTIPIFIKIKNIINPRTYKGEGGGGGGCLPPAYEYFLSFVLDDKTSAPDVFSSCSFIPWAHFEKR